MNTVEKRLEEKEEKNAMKEGGRKRLDFKAG